MAADAQKSLQHRSPFLRQPSFADSTWPENGVLRLVGTAFRFKLAPVTNGWTSLLPETPGVSARLTSSDTEGKECFDGPLDGDG